MEWLGDCEHPTEAEPPAETPPPAESAPAAVEPPPPSKPKAQEATADRVAALERSLALLQDSSMEGNISVSRVHEAMKCIGIRYTYDELARELLSNDTDGDGSMELHEFSHFLEKDAELERSGVAGALEPWSVGRPLALDALPLAARAFSAHAVVVDSMERNAPSGEKKRRPAVPQEGASKGGTQRAQPSSQPSSHAPAVDPSQRPMSAGASSTGNLSARPGRESPTNPSLGASHSWAGSLVEGTEEGAPTAPHSRHFVIFNETSEVYEEYQAMRAAYEQAWQGKRRRPLHTRAGVGPEDSRQRGKAPLSSHGRSMSNGALRIFHPVGRFPSQQPGRATPMVAFGSSVGSSVTSGAPASRTRPMEESSAPGASAESEDPGRPLPDAHSELAQYALAEMHRRQGRLPSWHAERAQTAERRLEGARAADVHHRWWQQQFYQQQQTLGESLGESLGEEEGTGGRAHLVGAMQQPPPRMQTPQPQPQPQPQRSSRFTLKETAMLADGSASHGGSAADALLQGGEQAWSKPGDMQRAVSASALRTPAAPPSSQRHLGRQPQQPQQAHVQHLSSAPSQGSGGLRVAFPASLGFAFGASTASSNGTARRPHTAATTASASSLARSASASRAPSLSRPGTSHLSVTASSSSSSSSSTSHLALASQLGSLAILADVAADGRPKTGLRLSQSKASLRPARVLEPVPTSSFAARAEELRREQGKKLTPAALERMLSAADASAVPRSILGGVQIRG